MAQIHPTKLMWLPTTLGQKKPNGEKITLEDSALKAYETIVSKYPNASPVKFYIDTKFATEQNCGETLATLELEKRKNIPHGMLFVEIEGNWEMGNENE